MIKRWLNRRARMVLERWMTSTRQQRRRRVRRGCQVALLVLLLLSCLTCGLLGIAVKRAAADPAPTAYDVVLVIDNSNSMFDKGGIGSDPDLQRIEAAQMFINYMGVDSGASAHRLGVVFFGGQAHLVVPLTPLADQARRAEMAELIAHPQRMDWTDPAEALTLAGDTLQHGRDGQRQPVVVLLTDGKPEWSNRPTGAERQEALADLQAIGQRYADEGTRLFVIALANAATDADPEIAEVYVPLWRELTASTGGRFYPARRADDLIGIYHDILVALGGLQTDGPVVEVELDRDPQVEVIPVESNLARVTFVVRASEGVTVTVHRPDGAALRAQDQDVSHAARGTTAIWAVASPSPGEWTVVMAGEGTVTVWKDYLPAPATPTPVPSPTPTPVPAPAPQLIVDVEPRALLAGQDLALSATLDPAPTTPVTLWVEWDLGDDTPQIVRLLDDGAAGDAHAGDGRHGGSLTVDRPGMVFLRVWAEAQGTTIDEWEGRVVVDARPTLEIRSPDPGEAWQVGQTATLRTHWVVGKETLALDGPVTATLRSAEGEVGEPLHGTVGEPLPVDVPRSSGVYTLTVEAAALSPGGNPIHGQAVTTVTVERPLPAWIWGLGGVVMLAGLGGGWAWYRQRNLPRLVGRLRVLEAPVGYAGPTLLDLSLLDLRSARLGGAGSELAIPAEGSPWAQVQALPDGSGMELTPCNGRAVTVNDHELVGEHLLADGDRIALDRARLRYEHLHWGL